MLVSRKWLSEYVNDLGNAKEIAEILTMHSFEIESFEEKDRDAVIDAKILPNRSHDCLCHRGIAKEIATISNKKFTDRAIQNNSTVEEDSEKLEIKIDDPKLCRRYIGKRVENILIKNSPDWLKEKLEILGERSICNIVDITNYIMLDLGQPMHAFDADKVKGKISVRLAKPEEKIILLTGEEVVLSEKDLIIADDEGALAIAGIKGGKKAEVTPETKNIIFESANFNPTTVRKTSQKTNIKNNSSKRFENEISPEIAEMSMRYAVQLTKELASSKETKFYKTVDIYPRKQNAFKVGISLKEINKLLGTEISENEFEKILKQTNWQYEKIKPIEKIKDLAESLVSKPYELGASVSFDAPNKFDCSSFTSYIFSQLGVALPRISVDQFVYSERIQKEDLFLGDLVFANSNNGKIYYESIEWMRGEKVSEGIDHVGLYLGDDKIIHASRYTGGVVIEKLSENEYFKKAVGFGRVPEISEERFVVTIPRERLDLRIKEDLIEEIGRIYGYDKIIPTLPQIDTEAKVNDDYIKSQQVRKILTGMGFSEVYNYAFSEEGEIEIENPNASNNSFLRKNLKEKLEKSLELNFKNAPFLGLSEIKIFEIGTIFEKEEKIRVAWGTKNKKETKVEEYDLEEALEKIQKETPPQTPPQMEGANTGDQSPEIFDNNNINIFDLPRNPDAKFRTISQYPFVLRDIAVWTPEGTSENEISKIISENATDLLVRQKLFDRFEKLAKPNTDEKTKISYAFNLVFQSQEKTLTDDEINKIMEVITNKLNSKDGWQVR